MMKDVIIKIDQNSMVYKQETVLGISYENLQGKIIFKFLGTFPKGTAYLEYERGTEKGYLQMNQVGEEYQLEIKSSLLTKEGRIYLQLRVTEDANPDGIPVFKSNKFYLEVKEAINATAEIPDEYPEWIDTANEKIKEMDNLNITTERVEDGVDIILTDKKGVTTRTEVKDGVPGPVGPPGAPGAVKMQVVDTLPETGETDTIYLVKKDNPGEQNLYDEYVYTDTGWEHIGDTSVDLTDYYTKEETDVIIPAILYINEVGGYFSTTRSMELSEDNKKRFSEFVNKHPNEPFLVYIFDYYHLSYCMDVCYFSPTGGPTTTTRNSKVQYVSVFGDNDESQGLGRIIYSYSLDENNIITFTTIKILLSNVYYPTKTYVDNTVSNKQDKLVAGNNIEISDDNVISAILQKEITELTDETIMLSQLNPGVYILKPTVKKIKYGSYDENVYITLEETQMMLVGTAGTTYNTAYIFTDYSIIRLNCFSNGYELLKSSLLDMSNILSKINTKSYTPTSDYHPATKKYVDDQVGNINTILATLTTVSEVSK